MRSGGWFEYGPGPVRLRRSSAFSFGRGGPFRMIELNLVGWSALLAAPALVGGVASLALGRPPAVGALGAAGAALAAVVWDRWRWRTGTVSVSSDLDIEILRRIVERLRAEGIDVTVDAADQGPAAPPVSEHEDVDSGGSPHGRGG